MNKNIHEGILIIHRLSFNQIRILIISVIIKLFINYYYYYIIR